MGEVYLAEDTRLNRKVALKFLPHHLVEDKDHLRRFEQEARAVAALSHPNVCTIHEVIETAEHGHCIVMEYVDGITLREQIAKGRMKGCGCARYRDSDRFGALGSSRRWNHPSRYQARQRDAPARWVREGFGFRARKAD
jgi:serine/threonine protein kinase